MPVSSAQARQEADPGPVDDGVGDDGRGDLAVQRVRVDPVAEAGRATASGSRRGGPAARYGSSGTSDATSSRWRSSLVNASSTASSGAVSPRPAAWRSCRPFASGSASSAAVEPAGLLEPLHLAGVHAHERRALRPRRSRARWSAPRCRRARASATSSVIDSSSGSRSAVGERAVGDRVAQQDLDVHLVVGAVDAGGVVDGVGVDPSAGERVLDPRALGEPEVAALGDDLAPQLGRVDAHRVVGPVADVGVGLGARLHERADPAVPQEVDRARAGSPRPPRRASAARSSSASTRRAAVGDRQRLRRHAGTRRRPARCTAGS